MAAREPVLPWWALVAMFALSQAFVLNIQLRREARSVFLSEIPMLLGLLYLPGHALIVVRLLGAAVGFGLIRRQYRQPQKLVFNVTLAAAEAAVGSLVYALLVQATGTVQLAAWLAGLAATAASSGFAAVAVGLIIHLLEGTVQLPELGRLAVTCTLQAVPIATVGVVVAAAWDDSPWAAVPLAATCALLLLAYRAYARLNERHLSLERLYRFTQIVSNSPEVDAILRSVLQQAKELLHADRARLTFLTDLSERRDVEISLAADGQLSRRPAHYVARDSWIVASIVGESRPLLVFRGTKVPRERIWLDECGLRDSLMVALRGEAGPVAILGVDDRLGDVRGFDKADVQLLETVANHAAVALRNGQLVDQLRHESLHDPLTGLPNRALFLRELEEKLVGPEAAPLAVGILDLDDFKDVNDTLGHQQGDVLLTEVASRLTAAAGEGVLVARLGGDEFAILVSYCAGVEHAEQVSWRLLRALQASIFVDGTEITVRGSLGIALAPQHRTSGPDLLKCADLAMYNAKQAARGVQVFNDSLDNTSLARLSLVTQLRRAIEAGDLNVYVQPKASLRTRQLEGVEALARWRHPERGTVSPEEFIPLAERSGLIRPLTELVLHRAIEACANWQDVAPSVGVSVNISARSLDGDQIVGVVAAILDRYGLPASLLTLEITESSIMADPAGTLGTLQQLRHRGIGLSVDDFGTGYSSLSYLRRLPVAEVKIDKSFVQRMAQSNDDAAIVKSIVDLAHSLKLKVVAEGVEDETAWQLLLDMGCDVAQGYLIARPMPLRDAPQWMASYRLFVSRSDRPTGLIAGRYPMAAGGADKGPPQDDWGGSRLVV
ncbi:MAG: bifunctional diguanylate cyclase/phosphodiesterase [Actinomycetota bacterium]|nr:bifunctional diguanylate cyclase/phosphodiesterase [Actinomycetota bacterium]